MVWRLLIIDALSANRTTPLRGARHQVPSDMRLTSLQSELRSHSRHEKAKLDHDAYVSDNESRYRIVLAGCLVRVFLYVRQRLMPHDNADDR